LKQEAVVYPPWVALAIRPNPGMWEYVRVNVDELMLDALSVSEYLAFKELLVNEWYATPFLFRKIICF
jgi:sucrose synthase